MLAVPVRKRQIPPGSNGVRVVATGLAERPSQGARTLEKGSVTGRPTRIRHFIGAGVHRCRMSYWGSRRTRHRRLRCASRSRPARTPPRRVCWHVAHRRFKRGPGRPRHPPSIPLRIGCELYKGDRLLDAVEPCPMVCPADSALRAAPARSESATAAKRRSWEIGTPSAGPRRT